MRRVVLALVVSLFFGFLAPFSAVLAQNQGVTVVDDFGRETVIPSEPLRIVSTAPSITETLFALGLGDRVVGVTSYCDYPPEVLEKIGKGEIAVIGGCTDPSLEKIVALDPDLVIGHNLLSPEFVQKLEDFGIPVVVLNTAKSIEGVYEDIKLIGKACWADEQASKLVDELRSSIAFWEEKLRGAEKVNAVEISWVNPLWVAGNGTYIHDIIEHAGGRNVFSDKKWWASVSDEEFVERDPEHIIIPYKHGQELIYEGIMEMKRKGLIHGEIHLIDPDIISRPGPRVAILFEELVKVLHPEIWEKAVEVERIIAPKRSIVGDLLTVFMVVRNPGLVAGEKVVEIAVDGEKLSQTIELAPNEVKLLNFTFIAEKEGAYIIRAGAASATVKVSQTAEKIIEEERKSFKEYVNEALSPISSEVTSLMGRVNSLEEDLDELSAAFCSQLSNVSSQVMEFNKRINSLNTMAAASIILSITAIIAVIASAIYVAATLRGQKAQMAKSGG